MMSGGWFHFRVMDCFCKLFDYNQHHQNNQICKLHLPNVTTVRIHILFFTVLSLAFSDYCFFFTCYNFFNIEWTHFCFAIYFVFQSILMDTSLDTKKYKTDFLRIIGVQPEKDGLVSLKRFNNCFWTSEPTLAEFGTFWTFLHNIPTKLLCVFQNSWNPTIVCNFSPWLIHFLVSDPHSLLYWQTMGANCGQF